MLEFGAFEAKNKLDMLLDQVEQGEEIVIARHGKAIARLDPNVERMDTGRALAALKRIRGRVHVAHMDVAHATTRYRFPPASSKFRNSLRQHQTRTWGCKPDLVSD